MTVFTVTWNLRVADLLPPVVRAMTFIEAPDISGSKFSCGLPLPMYIQFIVMSSPGHWKEKPSIGAQLWNWVQSSDSPQQLKRILLQQLTADIFKNPLVDVSQFPIVIVNDLKFTPNG